MKKVLFFVLAGGRGERLAPLTDACPKPLLHFGFSNRIIDFTLYNCLISAGTEIVLLTQHFSEMIEEYVEDHWRQAFAAQGKILRVARGNDFRKGYFSGTADAVFQNLSAQARVPELVVVLAADHIYRMNYRALVRFHLEHGRAATVGAVPCDREQAHRFGIIDGGQDGAIRRFHEKPQSLEGIVPPHVDPLASMGIYVFSTAPLLNYLKKNQQAASNDFGKDILPDIVKSRGALAYPFVGPDGKSAYWRDVGDLAAYRKASEEYFAGQYRRLPFENVPGLKNPSISFGGRSRFSAERLVGAGDDVLAFRDQDRKKATIHSRKVNQNDYGIDQNEMVATRIDDRII
jgi:glucose-1-phosphate adenylyltransferase